MKTHTKKKHKKPNKTRKPRKTRNMRRGGKALASGGYGCVFTPAIPCLGKQRNQAKLRTKISKLMRREDAVEEYNELQKITPYVKEIPHYDSYFLLNDIELCKPQALTKKDLESYDTKCKPLLEDGITSYNINSNLDRLYMLNMPYGGMELGEFIRKAVHKNQFIDINNALISLLIKGILPMNEKRIYHCDIKDSNILVDKTGGGGKWQTRIIDWSLAGKSTDGVIPEMIVGRPIQFNMPFSIILYNSVLDQMLSEFLKKNPSPNYESLRVFVHEYIYQWKLKRGIGHMETVDKIISILYGKSLKVNRKGKDSSLEFGESYYYIVNYLTTLLHAFTVNGRFDLLKYTEDVFLRIADVYGFLTCYLSFFEVLHYSMKSPVNEKICDAIKELLMKYLFSPRTEAYDITELEKELRGLNSLFAKMTWIQDSVSEKYVSMNYIKQPVTVTPLKT